MRCAKNLDFRTSAVPHARWTRDSWLRLGVLVATFVLGIVQTMQARPADAPAGPALGLPARSAVQAAIAAPLIRYNRAISGGAHTNGAWSGGASVLLAIAANLGDSSADARLLQQMRYTLTGGNDISANGGYPAQHERHVTAMFAIARHTPRIWALLSDAEKRKIDLLMTAAFVASAFTTNDNNPYILGGTQQYALDGDSNLHRDWNPNYREGMVGGVLVGMVYFGGASAASQVLEQFRHAQFAGELQDAGLSNIHQTFTWKAANPASSAPSASTIEQGIKSYRYHGVPLSDYMSIYQRLLQHTYGKVVACGLRSGEGIDGAGKVVSGCDQLPNPGARGMLMEFDSSDANGPRSSASYAYDGYRPHMSNLLVLMVGGYWEPTSGLLLDARSRLEVGNADLWYKIDRGYIGYAKGKSQGTFDRSRSEDYGFVYNASLWNDVLKPYLAGEVKIPKPPAGLMVE